jgi:hypothetical protein
MSERLRGAIGTISPVPVLDLGVPAGDRDALARERIGTLADWAARREQVQVAPETAALLDAHARLSSLGVPKELADRLVAEGIDSATGLAALPEAERANLERRLRLPGEGLVAYQERARDTTAAVATALASTIIYGANPFLPWGSAPRPSRCGTCSEATSIVGRYRYFRYLVTQTGKTVTELDTLLLQNLPALTAADGAMRLSQVTICNEVLLKRYPGALSDQEAGPGRRLLVLAYLTLFPGSVVEVAHALLQAGGLSTSESNLVDRFRGVLAGGIDVLFSAAEISAFDSLALAEIQAQVEADSAFADRPASEVSADSRRRLDELLEPARQRAREADREALKRRSGTPPKSDHQLFRELYIETGLGSCEQTTRLDQAISSLQAYLNDRGAAAHLTVNGAPYLAYDQWRGEQLGQYYPELQALLRDDVLSGERDAWDRGSIVRNRALNRPILQQQLSAVRNAIKHGYLAENKDRQKLVDGSKTIESLGLVALEDSAYFPRFEEGLTVIDQILAADDKVASALAALDGDEAGLALGHLNDANNALLQMGDLAFSAGSSLATTWRLDYRELAALPSDERRTRLDDAFAGLFGQNGEVKRLYQATTDSGLTIRGLNRSSGAVDDPTAWSVSGVAGHVDFDDGAGIHCSNITTPPDERGAATAQILNGATCKDVALDDADFKLSFVVQSTAYSRAPAVVDSYAAHHREMVGLVVRQQANGSGYWIVIETALTDAEKRELSRGVSDDEQAPPPPFWWSLSIYRVTGSDEQLLQGLARPERFTLVTDGTYALEVSTTGQEIRVSLSTPDGLHRALRASDGSAAAFSAGSFGVRATATVDASFGPLFVERGTACSIPPFYAMSRPGSNFFYLRSHSIYDHHEDHGDGMATLLTEPTRPLVYPALEVAAEKLAIRFDHQPAETWYLVFASGRQAISLSRLDQLLDRCLALSAYLRYAVIPVRMAQAYAASGDFRQAETVMRVVYDDSADPARRVIYPRSAKPPFGLTRALSIDERLLRLRLGEILIRWAEWLFRQDTEESRRLAFRLCTRLLALYEDPDFCGCDAEVEQLSYALRRASQAPARVSTASARGGQEIVQMLRDLDRLRGRPLDHQLVTTLSRGLVESAGRQGLGRGLRMFRDRLRTADGAGTAAGRGNGNGSRWTNTLKEAEVRAIGRRGTEAHTSSARLNLTPLRPPFWDFLNYCVPTNPVEIEYKRRACLILSHLRHCRNVLGYQDDYVPPLRFDALLARARTFADLALSAERDLINFRERFEAETFSLLQAQNALEVANATVTLEGMRVSLAESEIITARLQHERAQAAQGYYDGLVDGGLSDWERRALNTARAAIDASALATGVSFLGGAAGAIASIGTGAIGQGVGGIGSTLASVPAGIADQLRQFSAYYGMQASFERRDQEWRFQAQMSRFDVAIAETNVDQAFQRREVAAQQQAVAELQRDGAADSLHFLNNKFLNAAMYLWMTKTVREQYRKRLDYAIYAAYMAERALAFELQEPVKVIRFDYFDPRRDGVLGATTLQTDLATLAQLKLASTRRKLQVSKTLSLLQVAPVELDRFKYGSDAGDLGKLRFRTSLDVFDRDFPGHYLRLVKAVKVTVVALVPPTEGIRATLSTSGVSKTVIGGPPFTEQIIKRPPESVALSAPFQATGVFVLNYEDELLLPFEGTGVETEWTFEMPKAANHFDYSTIADVFLTIEYTALSHNAYRAELVERLDRGFSADRAFGFRHHFPDQWYDLHNPDLVSAPQQPMVVKLTTRREDFPPNVDDLAIEHVALYFSSQSDPISPVDIAGFTFTSEGGATGVGGAATTANGLASTRQPSGANWTAVIGKSPVGEWQLALPNTQAMRDRFKAGDDEIEDILFVITYSARTAAWPR